ncbi:MAG: hypothetical protein EXX96DRAFT_548412 [Benjaminiella poitrasii]|nr:MAG: hypothetical protein EXX96DRAFT_548412 [Benjaminiella poitrasii]
MDPQACTAILLKQQESTEKPFYIIDNNEGEEDEGLLRSIFSQVYKATNLESCLGFLKSSSSTSLLLIELDETQLPNIQIEIITRIIDKLTPVSETIPIIVYSTNDNPQFMLDCIQAGATDYILRPLRPDVIKTLFLNLFRQHHNKQQRITSPSLYEEDHSSSTTSSTTDTTSSLISPVTPIMSAYLPERIKVFNSKNTNFTKAIIDNYIPLTSDSTLLPSWKQLKSDSKRERLERKVSSWDFSPLDLSHEELIYAAVIMISQVLKLPQVTANFTEEQLYSFITDLSTIYHDENPYHNFAHAVDVLQCIYYFLCQMDLIPFAAKLEEEQQQRSLPQKSILSACYQYILRPIDIFSILIAAIGHDTAHPGVNNAFLINTSAPLALLYNDQSVLENFHAMTLFQLLKKHKFVNDQQVLVFGSNTKEEYNDFRKLVITSILATDMSLHGDYVKRIKEQKERLTDDRWDPARCLEERLLFCSGLIKCADISNVARPFQRAFEWAQILIEEFASQGDLERELGMSVSPMNDRSLIVLEDSQIGFIRFVALGLFESVSDYIEELSFPVDHIKRNLSIWEDRKHKNETNQPERPSATTTIVDSSHGDSDSNSTDNNSYHDSQQDIKDYHSEAANVLSKNSDKDSVTATAPSLGLPKMPAVAMSTIVPSDNYEYDDCFDVEVRSNNRNSWSVQPHESSIPVYCQCVLQ